MHLLSMHTYVIRDIMTPTWGGEGGIQAMLTESSVTTIDQNTISV